MFHKTTSLAFSVLILAAASFVAACSPVGMAAGAGAAVGMAATQEGGVVAVANDLKIKALVTDRWLKYKVDTFTKLNLTVNQGRVLITGVVQDPDDRVEAVRLAWQVEDVKQVINEIRVADSDGVPGFVRDQWITTRLRTAITFDGDIHALNYTIDTVQGTVYLMGAARSQKELDKVIETARTIPNVKQVISYVKQVGEQVSDTAVPVTTSGMSDAINDPVSTSPYSGSDMAVDPAPVESEQLGPQTW